MVGSAMETVELEEELEDVVQPPPEETMERVFEKVRVFSRKLEMLPSSYTRSVTLNSPNG